MTVEGLYDVARNALAGPGQFEISFNQLYGYPERLHWSDAQAADADGTEAIDPFTTAGDRNATARARADLEAVLARWGSISAKTWEYTWTRSPAAGGTQAATVWTVHHEGGKTTATATNDSGSLDLTPSSVTIAGTVTAAESVLQSGGWVDVSTDMATGLNLLIAVDPSPSAKGDAYWIRIEYTDLSAQAAATALAAARDRWAAAAPAAYSYVWRYRGEGKDLTYRVTRKGDTATLKREPGTPIPEALGYATPRIEDTFAMLDEVLAQGGEVSATYDKKLGYPTSVTMVPNGDAGAAGVITITNLVSR